MESKTRGRLSGATSFLRKNIRRIIVIIVVAIVAQLAGVPIPNTVYPSDYLYPLSFLPLVFIAGGGGMIGLVGYSVGATVGDLGRFGFSITLILFDLVVFGFAGWFTGIAMKTRTGVGQVILTLVTASIGGVAITFLSPIGANIGRGTDYNTLYSRYLYGWLPFFIVPAEILSYWMGRIRDQIVRIVGSPADVPSKEEKPRIPSK